MNEPSHPRPPQSELEKYATQVHCPKCGHGGAVHRPAFWGISVFFSGPLAALIGVLLLWGVFTAFVPISMPRIAVITWLGSFFLLWDGWLAGLLAVVLMLLLWVSRWAANMPSCEVCRAFNVWPWWHARLQNVVRPTSPDRSLAVAETLYERFLSQRTKTRRVWTALIAGAMFVPPGAYAVRAVIHGTVQQPAQQPAQSPAQAGAQPAESLEKQVDPAEHERAQEEAIARLPSLLTEATSNILHNRIEEGKPQIDEVDRLVALCADRYDMAAFQERARLLRDCLTFVECRHRIDPHLQALETRWNLTKAEVDTASTTIEQELARMQELLSSVVELGRRDAGEMLDGMRERYRRGVRRARLILSEQIRE